MSAYIIESYRAGVKVVIS